MVSDEIVHRRIKKMYRLEDVMQRYNADKKYSFPQDLEKNIQKNLTFEITEYATLIFQNLRSLYSLD
jgi:hypothetical protein